MLKTKIKNQTEYTVLVHHIYIYCSSSSKMSAKFIHIYILGVQQLAQQEVQLSAHAETYTETQFLDIYEIFIVFLQHHTCYH